MALPGKLKQFNIFVDGASMIGVASEVTLPKLTHKTIAYRGGGMLAPVKVDLGLDDGALDMDITVGGLSADLLARMYEDTADAMQLRFVGAYQNETSPGYTTCEIQTRGRFTEVDFGTAKVGEDTNHKYTLNNTYVKITVGTTTVLEVDALNLVLNVNGVDRSADLRRALGM
ncbi:phage major tail tube protein [Serratia marcescens]|uniref:Phage major tail tube protein n=1 Tax=Serratia marcescens TaxID=615 RepID=A0A9X8VJJ6_SERMA|nr:phage major tail tube protein [Serratia marcescens]MBS3892282.1 phage major tail tube protein [Serratia marcescens]